MASRSQTAPVKRAVVPSLKSPPLKNQPLNSSAGIKNYNQFLTLMAIQSAYDNCNSALNQKKTDEALRFQSSEYTEFSADNRARPQETEQARLALSALFQDYAQIFAASRVASYMLDAAGGATVHVLDRRTLFRTAGGYGTQTDRQCRDYLVQDGGTWRLVRRRVLSETRHPAQAPQELAAPATPTEAADPVFGPNAPLPVKRFRFMAYFYSAPVTMQFFHNTKSASRTLATGLPASDYARVFADICTELGVKNKCVGDSVYVTEAGGVSLSGSSKVALQMDTIRP